MTYFPPYLLPTLLSIIACIMKARTVQINWHDARPIFSVDFDSHWMEPDQQKEPTTTTTTTNQDIPPIQAPKSWRFATAGGDNNVRVSLYPSFIYQ